MRHEVIQVLNVSSFEHLRHEWTRLEGESRHHPLGVTHGYCELAAAKLLAAGDAIRIVKIYDHEGLALLWPLSIQRKGFIRIAYDLRCGSGADRGGPLVRHSVSADCLRAAIRAIAETGADIFVLDWVDDDSDLQKLMSGWAQPWIIRRMPQRLRAARGSDGARRYTIKFDDFPAWGDFLATKSRSIRHNHDRRLRRLLAEQKQVEFGWCKTAEETAHVLRWLFEHKRRWAEERGTEGGTLIARDIEDFYIAMARRIDLSTTPLVAFIKVEGNLVAASLISVGRKLMECLVITHDKAFHLYSPGILLLRYQSKWAYEAGCEFDMLRYDADYKTQWANHMPLCRRHSIFLAASSVAGFATFVGLTTHKLASKGRATFCEQKVAKKLC